MQSISDWERLRQLLAGHSPAESEMSAADEERQASFAQRLGVATLLYSRLAQRDGVAMSTTSLEILRTAYMHTAMRNTRVYHFLTQVLLALAEADVPVILLKGAYLAKCVYKNIAARPMGDIDLLISATHIATAMSILTGMGYHSRKKPVTPHRLRSHHITLTHENGISLEVHGSTRFIHLRRPISEDALVQIWERTRSVRINGAPARVLSPEDQLLHLCAHASVSHRFVIDLRPFYDIAEVICHYQDDIDWQAVMTRGEQWGMANPVSLTLYLAAAWANAVVPAEVLRAIPSYLTDAVLVEHVRNKVLNAPLEYVSVGIYPPTEPPEDTCKVFSIATCIYFGSRGVNIRWRQLLHTIFPSPKEIAKQYSVSCEDFWCVLLCYPRRCCDIIRHYWQLGRRIARGELIVRSTFRQERLLQRMLQR